MVFPFNDSILLEDSRVRIEPITVGHEELLEPVVNNNPELLRYSPVLMRNRTDLEKYIKSNLALRERRLKYPLAIYDKESERYAGSSSYLRISDKDSHLEIGSTWIGREFQRSGLNRHMKFLMLSYAFENLGAIRVAFRTDARNEQSKTAIQAIGATYEGTLRKHMLMTDGHVRDTVCYSILKEEWPGLLATVFQSVAG
ncbi:MAG: GNAT family N-acetyltransferase [Bacteroidia bacterium]|nr:GNAT family N-acetyltransferase [Bacteroidia bacterium]